VPAISSLVFVPFCLSSPCAHHYYELVKTKCVTFTCESKLITDAGVVRGCDAVLLLVRGGFWHVGQLRLVQSTATQHLQVIHPSRPSGVRAQPVSACIPVSRHTNNSICNRPSSFALLQNYVRSLSTYFLSLSLTPCVCMCRVCFTLPLLVLC
jgi:hypothetical protein